MSNKMNCKVILDLLPLYHDEVVSEETKLYVKKHLDSCDDCKKEYELLCEVLPTISTCTTQDKFIEMLKKQKQKRITNMIMIILLSFTLTTSCLYALTQIPFKIIQGEQIDVLSTYVVETADGPYAFVWYESPIYTGVSSVTMKTEENSDEVICVISRKVPLFSKEVTTEQSHVYINIFQLENKYGSVNEIIFNDNSIWSFAVNGDDIVPVYVEEYLTNYKNIQKLSYSFEEDYFGISYDGIEMMYWNIEGEYIETKIIE